jgi:hypothetical protein
MNCLLCESGFSVARSKCAVLPYLLRVIDDPDGHQLFFNYPNQTSSGKLSEMKRNRPVVVSIPD